MGCSAHTAHEEGNSLGLPHFHLPTTDSSGSCGSLCHLHYPRRGCRSVPRLATASSVYPTLYRCFKELRPSSTYQTLLREKPFHLNLTLPSDTIVEGFSTFLISIAQACTPKLQDIIYYKVLPWWNLECKQTLRSYITGINFLPLIFHRASSLFAAHGTLNRGVSK